MKLISRIIIVGYYNHYNLGDEQYKDTFEYMLDKYLPQKKNYIIQFVDCDLLSTLIIVPTDIIIVGGGDILNYYFIDKLYDVFCNKPNKIIAVSVGLPYSDILMHTDKLNIIDYIFIRTKRDIGLFSKYFLKERIFYLPDISYYVTKTITSKKYSKLINNPLSSHSYKNIFNKIKIQESKTKIIAFSLSRHIYNALNPEYYYNIVREISVFIIFLINLGFYIILLPFNTSNIIQERNQNFENDIILHEDIFDILPTKYKNSDHILNIDFTLTTKEVFQIYEYVHISIPMRFHACLFSIYKRIPILPIFTQKKIRNLLLDIQWSDFYELPKNNKDVPISICQNTLQNEFHKVLDNYHGLRESLNITCNELFETNLQKTVPILIEIIQTNYPKINTVIHAISNKVLHIFNKLQTIAKEYGYSDFRAVDNLELKMKLVNVVNFFIIGDFDSCYSYGLIEKMFQPNFNYSEEWKWIIHDWQEKHSEEAEAGLFSNPNGLFNLHYIPQADKSGAHRSGWQYVYNEIAKLHNNTSPIYLDLYLDRTFHWKKEILKMVDIIPYRNPWVGFIHHTFDQTFSTYNNAVMFNDPDFILSLNLCKGIIVLSKYLKKQIEDIFAEKNLDIPVFALIHPTETQNIPKFNFQKFLENPDKKIVHVGGWLRNVFSFFQLTIPSEIPYYPPQQNLFRRFISLFQTKDKSQKSNIRKVALKGKGMNNYYPSSDNLFPFIKNKTFNITDTDKNCSQNNNELKNNWYRHLYDYLQSIYNSVEIIECLSNEEYDEMMTKEILYIQLVDASTVNTVIECLVRNTPILINKHPAVVEILGEDYPLYYSEEKVKKINLKLIKETTEYLQKRNKESYEIANFIEGLQFIMFGVSP